MLGSGMEFGVVSGVGYGVGGTLQLILVGSEGVKVLP